MVQVIMFALRGIDLDKYQDEYEMEFLEELSVDYPTFDSAVYGIVDNIRDAVDRGEMTLDTQSVTDYVRKSYGDIDEYNDLLDAILDNLNLTESKKVTEGKADNETSYSFTIVLGTSNPQSEEFVKLTHHIDYLLDLDNADYPMTFSNVEIEPEDDDVIVSGIVDIVDDEDELSADDVADILNDMIIVDGWEDLDVELYSVNVSSDLDESKKVTESKDEKTVKVMAYGKLYYEFSEEEWDGKSEDEKEATITDTADQATEEEGHTVEADEVEIITESKKVTEAKDDLEHIKNLIIYEKTQEIFEELYHNKQLDCDYDGSKGVIEINSADEQTLNSINTVMVNKLHYNKMSDYVYELKEGPIYRDIKGGFNFKGYTYKVNVKFILVEGGAVTGVVTVTEIDTKVENKNSVSDVDEIFSKYAGAPVKVKNLKQKWCNASDNNRNPVYAGGWTAMVVGDNFEISITNSLKLDSYKVAGENLDEGDRVAKNLYFKSADIGYDTGLYNKKVTEEKAEAEKSAGEYWVGDPCYVLSDDIYDNIWGKKYNYRDGLIDCGNGLSFDVHRTAWGDGCYEGSNGFYYGVDSGTLAVIPKELVAKKDGEQFGTYHKSTNGEIEYENGVFHIEFDNEILEIDTDPKDDDYYYSGIDDTALTENKKVTEADNGSSEFELFVSEGDLDDVNTSSLLFDSGTTICKYTEDGYTLSLVANGDIRIQDRETGDVYKNYGHFPQELIDAIKSGKLDESDRFEVVDNNWFEFFLDGPDGEQIDLYEVADVEGALNGENKATELEVFMKDALDGFVSQLNESKKLKTESLSSNETPVVNPDDKDYYSNKGYIISLYPRSRSRIIFI